MVRGTVIQVAFMKVLKEKWYVVDEPWGDGSIIQAASPDAAGEFVCDCEGLIDEEDLDRVESAQEIAEYLVNLHNANLLD